MCSSRLAANTGRKKVAIWAPSNNFVGLYVFAIKAHIDNWKKLVKQKYLPHMSYSMLNFGPLLAEIGSLVWSTPANFNGFRVLASLLQRRRWTKVDQSLHDVWPSGLVHYIYVFWGSWLLILPRWRAKFTLRPGLVFSYFGSVTARHTALEQWSSDKLYRVVQGVTLQNFSS